MIADPVSLRQAFGLAKGQSAAVEGLEVRMDGVIRDERCPIDVECVHPGDATVVIGIRRLPAGVWTTHRLHTSGHEIDRQVTLEACVVQLLRLEPPRRWGRPAPRDYRATLRVDLTWAARLRRLVGGAAGRLLHRRASL